MIQILIFTSVVIISHVFGERIPTIISNNVRHSLNNKGTLKPLSNAHLLQLSGSPFERGYAHGYLLAAQIIDWSYFYQLQYNMNGNVTYYEEYAKWISENQFAPVDYQEEVRGILSGMKDSNVSLEFTDLNREFNEVDIYVINSYLEGSPTSGARISGPYATPKPFPKSSARLSVNGRQMSSQEAAGEPPACTQFVAWGKGMTHDGQTLAGRNMDGETDPWFVTVSHLIVFAIEPYRADELRFVSIMWPGHIGTLTAMNEDGLSAMLNCGAMNSGPVATNITVIEYSIRSVISTMRSGDATPERVLSAFNQFKSSEGGISGAGSVVVFSAPTVVKRHNAHKELVEVANEHPGFIAELDRYNSVMRTSEADNNINMVAQSNHFIEYGVDKASESDPMNPAWNFGERVGFSSAWRLQAIRAVLKSVNRTAPGLDGSHSEKFIGLGGQFGAGKAQRAPSHGFTEHSVTFAPSGYTYFATADSEKSEISRAVLADTVKFNPKAPVGGGKRPVFALANSNPWANAGVWDAPYNTWVEYNFDDMFD